MKRTLLIAFISCCFLNTNQAQEAKEIGKWEVAFTVFPHMSKTLFSNDVAVSLNSKYDPKIALGFGSICQKMKTKQFGYFFGLNYLNTGNKFEVNPDDDLRWPSQHDGAGGFDPTLPGGIITSDTKSLESIHYVEVPVGVILGFGKNERLFIKPSISLAVPLFYSTKAVSKMDGDRRVTRNSYKLPDTARRTVFNSSVAVGRDFNLKGKRFFIEGKTYYSPFSTLKSNDIGATSHLFGCGLNLGFYL